MTENQINLNYFRDIDEIEIDLQSHIYFLNQKLIELQQENIDLKDKLNQLKLNVEWRKGSIFKKINEWFQFAKHGIVSLEYQSALIRELNLATKNCRSDLRQQCDD